MNMDTNSAYSFWYLLQFVVGGYMVFLAYGLFSIAVRSGSIRGLEAARHWLKAFFWVSFSVYLVVEALFTVFFIYAQTISLVGFKGIMYFFMDFIHVNPNKGPLKTWFIYSLIILALIMSPFMAIFGRVSRMFKKKALEIIAKDNGNPYQARMLSTNPRRLLPEGFVNEMVNGSKDLIEWALSSFSSKNKFDIDTENQDLMEESINNRKINFWESEISFSKKVPYKNSKGKTEYEIEDVIMLFNGLVIKAPGALPTPMDTLLAFTGSIPEIDEEKSIREEIRYNFIMEILQGIWSAMSGNTLLTDENSSENDFKREIITCQDIDLNDDNVQFIGISGADLYVFVHTGLSGNMFDFHMSKTVKENLKIFVNDIAFVNERIRVIDEVIKQLPKLMALRPVEKSAA